MTIFFSHSGGHGPMRFRFVVIFYLVLVFDLPVGAQWSPLDPVASVKQTPNGATLTFKSGGTLKVEICSDSLVHVLYSPTAVFPAHKEYVVTKTDWPPVHAKVEDSPKEVTISTAALNISVGKEDGGITFSGPAKERLFRDGRRIMTPETVNGEKTYRAETVAEMYGTREGFYGLGQHQAGVWNYHGESVDLSQENTNIAVPMLLSSNGYGIFWNNTSRTRVNNRLCLVAGHTDFGSAKTATTRRRKFSRWHRSIATCTFRWITSCRTGSGGTARASTSSTRIIPIPKAWWASSTRTIFT